MKIMIRWKILHLLDRAIALKNFGIVRFCQFWIANFRAPLILPYNRVFKSEQKWIFYFREFCKFFSAKHAKISGIFRKIRNFHSSVVFRAKMISQNFSEISKILWNFFIFARKIFREFPNFFCARNVIFLFFLIFSISNLPR